MYFINAFTNDQLKVAEVAKHTVVRHRELPCGVRVSYQ